MEIIDNIIDKIIFARSDKEKLEIIDEIPVDIINERGIFGFTILMRLSQGQSPAIIQALINKGADVNIKCSRTRITPLMSAMLRLHSKEYKIYCNVAVLLENNANPNIQDVRGRTALMLAAEKNYLSIVDLLLNNEFGTKTNIKDDEGFTAYDLSTDDDIKKMIKKREKRMEDIYTKMSESIAGRGPGSVVASYLSFGSKKRSIRKNKKSKTNRKVSRKSKKSKRKSKKASRKSRKSRKASRK